MQKSSPNQREWVFVHTLAILAITEFLILMAFNVILWSGGTLAAIPALIMKFCGIGAIALLWFWVRMLVDFFRRRPESHPVAWGWALTLGCYFGAMAYFFAIWRPRNRAVAA